MCFELFPLWNDASFGLLLSFYTDARVAHSVQMRSYRYRAGAVGLESGFSLQQLCRRQQRRQQQQLEMTSLMKRPRYGHGPWESNSEYEYKSDRVLATESESEYAYEWNGKANARANGNANGIGNWNRNWKWNWNCDVSASIWSWAFRLGRIIHFKYFKNCKERNNNSNKKKKQNSNKSMVNSNTGCRGAFLIELSGLGS